MKNICLLLVLYALRAAAAFEVAVSQRVIAHAAWRLNAARRDLAKVDADIRAIESPPEVMGTDRQLVVLRPLSSRSDIH